MMNLKKFAVAFAASCLLSAPAFAQSVYVTVNKVGVPKYVADVLVAEQKAEGVEDGEVLQNNVRDHLINRELLLAEARRAKLDKKPEILGMMDIASNGVLVRAFVEDYIKANPIADSDVTATYEQVKQQMAGTSEYRVRHILVEKEAQAKNIIAQLGKGIKFASLAKSSSLDPASKDKGGELEGWMSPAAFVPPFAQALTQLKKGQYSKEPVQTNFGYHVIMVDDVRSAQFPPLDQVRAQIRQSLSQQKVNNLLKELREKAEIK